MMLDHSRLTKHKSTGGAKRSDFTISFHFHLINYPLIIFPHDQISFTQFEFRCMHVFPPNYY